ncbi:MAG TPA: hypothetical protein VFX50_03270, partial [Gemmatimonadales bacterium]|nr:hypothetical protein [Gemmatimonadales bacterium]
MTLHPRIPFAALLIVSAACGGDSAPLAESDQPEDPVAVPMAIRAEAVVPGRVLVRMREGADLAGVARGKGLAVEERRRGFTILRGAAAGSERRVARELAANPAVLWAEPDFLRQADAVDPR